MSCRYAHADMVKLLLDAGAEPNAKTKKFGESPMIRAIKYNNLDILKQLLNSGKIDMEEIHPRAYKRANDDTKLFLSTIRQLTMTVHWFNIVHPLQTYAYSAECIKQQIRYLCSQWCPNPTRLFIEFGQQDGTEVCSSVAFVHVPQQCVVKLSWIPVTCLKFASQELTDVKIVFK